MVRTLFFPCVVLFLILSSCTSKTVDKNKTDTNDSIQKYLDLAGNDSLEFEKRNQYNDKAFSLLDLNENDTLTRFYLGFLCSNYINCKKWASFEKVSKIHFKKSLLAKDTLGLARCFSRKAIFFKDNKIIDSALYYFIKAEKFYKIAKNEKGLSRVYFHKSLFQLHLDDYLGAELSSNLAYNYLKKKPICALTLDVIIMQGNVASNLKDYKRAINKFNEGIYNIKKYKLEKTDIDCRVACLNNIGNVYREQKKFKKAISYFKLVLKEKDLKKKNSDLYAISLNNIGFCNMQLNDNKGLPDLFFKAAKILDSIGNKNEYVVSNLFISQFYFKHNDTLKAKIYAGIALNTAKSLNAPYYYLTALSNAGSVNREMASKYIKEYHEKNDSLLFIERNARNQYYRIQLETDEITHEKETAIKQKWIIGGVLGILMLISILLLIINKQRSKQKELQFIQSQQKSNEEIYDLMLVQKSKEELARLSEKKRIAIELHDGVMNKLASTRLNLDVLQHKSDKQTIAKCLTHVEEIYHIEQEIRNIAHNLNQEAFITNNSYVTLIHDFITTQNNTSKTKFRLEMDERVNWEVISSEIKMNLFRIIQEASHNINKFAEAKNAIISLLFVDKNLYLSISDDGNGFDVETKTEGIGLNNIKQRVESLNGKLVIQSKKQGNTSLNIVIPIA